MSDLGINLDNAVKKDYMSDVNTTTQNNTGGGSIWDTIAGNMGDTLNGVANIINAAKGNNNNLPGGSYIPPQDPASTNRNWLWIGGGGLLLVIMMFFLFTGKKS